MEFSAFTTEELKECKILMDLPFETKPTEPNCCKWGNVWCKDDRIHTFSYNGNRDGPMTGPFPWRFGELTGLFSLSIVNTKLNGSITRGFKELTQLETLNLSNNTLTGEIPVELTTLTKLRYLNLDFNQLSGNLPAELGNMTELKELNLYKNQFTGTLPSTLTNLKKLTHMDVSRNNLSGPLPLLPRVNSICTLSLADRESNKFECLSKGDDPHTSPCALDFLNRPLPECPVPEGSASSTAVSPVAWDAEDAECPLTSAAVVDGDKLVLVYMRDVKDTVCLHSLATGERLDTIALPPASISGLSAKKKQSDFFFSYTSFLSPGTIVRYDVPTRTASEFKRVSVAGFNPDEFVVRNAVRAVSCLRRACT
ncbi:hypothetical protein H9P43_006113 [Blastocladiella emersonii ATCC 22665]|nr:hypothetical protein H9P43_006113 [Blastocladiella emersonii ATCC 22665]